MHRAAKVDANQTDITAALRQMGASVQHLHTVGAGCPDLLVGFRGVNLLVEVKDGEKVPSKRKLTPDEQEWHEQWRGQVSIVESVEDAVALLTDDGSKEWLTRHDASLLCTIQLQDAEIQRLKAELYEARGG